MASVRAIQTSPNDNVAVVLSEVRPGDEARVVCEGSDVGTVVVRDDIPQFHKVALRDLRRGDTVLKYGSYIGEALTDIPQGSHVHTHNCASSDEARERHLGEQASTGVTHAPGGGLGIFEGATFRGYRRADGTVGVRNLVLVLPASICASDVCARICQGVPGTVSIHNQNGCSQVDRDRTLTLRTLAGVAANPNVHSVLVVGLGCEGCQASDVVAAIGERSGKDVRRLVIQEVGGVAEAIREGMEIARELVGRAAACEREECPVADLVVGTNCGGSDTTSGLGANPLIGVLSDELGGAGATSVLCETPELFGAEEQLARRAATPELGRRIFTMVGDYERYVGRFGAQMREGNPSPGNVAGGLTTLEEKSLGCVYKGGHGRVRAVCAYAERVPSHAGLVVMDTPGNDPTSVMGLAAGGCQVVLFSTGLGTPSGNPIVPVLRLTANPRTALTMRDTIDFDAHETIFGDRPMAQIAQDLAQTLLGVCGGTLTKAERHGFTEIALPHLCNYM